MAEVWLQLLQIKEEEAVDRKELLQLWKQMAQLLQDCQKDGELDTKTQQHVRYANISVCLIPTSVSSSYWKKYRKSAEWYNVLEKCIFVEN